MRQTPYPISRIPSIPLDDLPDTALAAALGWLRFCRRHFPDGQTPELSWPIAPGTRGLIAAGYLRGCEVDGRFIGRLMIGGRR